MKMKFYLLFSILLIILTSCAKSARSSNDYNDGIVEVRDTVIHLENILSLSDHMCLSEIADSISYIPLETKKEILFSAAMDFKFTKQFIITLPRFLFDWNGKFIKQIGSVGQGPGEDPNRFGNLLESENCFYTVGNKIIEYDKNGKYKGKEVAKFIIPSVSDSSLVYNVFREVNATYIDNHIILYQYPDSLIWIDVNMMKVSNTERVIESGDITMRGIFTNSLDCFFPTYNERRYFYNFFNDTIFRLTGNNLLPEWVIDLGEKKLPNEISYNLGSLLRKTLSNMELISSSELITKSDGKYKIYAVYETDRYLFFNYIEIRYLAQRRNIEEPEAHVIFYDKQTRKIINVKRGGIIDDLDNGPNFYPTYGAIDEKMISVKWPWELKEYVEANRDNKKISPKLLNLVDGLKDDDNPVIIIVNLKSNI